MKLFQNQLIKINLKQSPDILTLVDKIIKFVFCFLFIFLSSSPAFSALDTRVYSSLPSGYTKQLELIDAEIYLLKAELALENKNIIQLKNYISKLIAMENILKISMRKRLLNLKKGYYKALNPKSKMGRSINKKESNYDANKKESNYDAKLDSVVVLLPQTGRYAELGGAIIEGIESNISKTIYADNIQYIDTNAYTSMFDLWEFVKLYSPSLVLGPLLKKNVIEFNQLNTRVPTLYLNEIDEMLPNSKSISLSRIGSLDNVLTYISVEDRGKVLVLSDNSKSSVALKQQFLQLCHNQNIEPVLKTMDKSIYKTIPDLLNLQQAKARKSWLEKVIGRSIKVDERARKDITKIISFLSEEKAGQITPLLQFYQTNKIEHIWFPSKLPFVSSFAKKIAYWENTTAVLPKYFVDYFIIRKQKQKPPRDMSNKLGTFYALGKTASEVIVKMVNKDRSPIVSKLGLIIFEGETKIKIEPKLVKIHKGKLSLKNK